MRIPKLQRHDAVRIHWSDPHGLEGSWEPVTTRDMRIDGCVTVGQVHKVHKDRVTVVCTWDKVEHNAHGGMTIPFCLIERIEVLK